MEWRYFTKVAEKAKDLTTKLEEETQKIGQIYEFYWKLIQEELGTSEEWKDLNELKEGLKKIQAQLRDVKGKAASEKILIKFVGATSSGKSSVINALLQSRRLPVGFMQTTMCSFKVCIVEEKEWSVTVKRENGDIVPQSSPENEEDLKNLLSNMSGKKHANDRKEKGIGTRSVVQVNWPQHLCKVLPPDIVLFDTPGFGEDVESDKVITESCKKADIIVAVMDVMSPSKAAVAELVNNANCKFAFGVFTKWDECKAKAEEEGEDTVDVGETCEGYKQDFRAALNGKCEMFVVDVKSPNTNDGEFKKFEKNLQDSATKLKGESLIMQAKSVHEKLIEVNEKLQDIVDAKEKQKAASIEKEKDFIGKDKKCFKDLDRILTHTEKLTLAAYNENTKRIEDFEKGVKEGKPEDVVHAEFVLEVNKCTQDTLIKQRNQIQSAFTIWAENHNCDSDVNKFLSNIDGIKLDENQGLSEEEYDWKLDPNVYFTNDYISAAMLVGGCAGVAIAGVAGVASLAGVIAAESLPAVAGTTVLGSAAGSTGGIGGTFLGLFRVGKLVRWFFPISEYKLRCWRKKLRSDLKNLYKCCKELIFNDIRRIKDKASEKLNHAEAEKAKKIREEERKAHNLTIWANELQESQSCLTETNKELDELLKELSDRLSDRLKKLSRNHSPTEQIDAAARTQKPKGASEDHTESQSAIDSNGTAV